VRYLGIISGAGRVQAYDSSYSPGVRADGSCMDTIVDPKRCPTNCAAGLDDKMNELDCTSTGFDIPAYTETFVPTYKCARKTVSRISTFGASLAGIAGRDQ
jgi:hypothetical protein